MPAMPGDQSLSGLHIASLHHHHHLPIPAKSTRLISTPKKRALRFPQPASQLPYLPMGTPNWRRPPTEKRPPPLRRCPQVRSPAMRFGEARFLLAGLAWLGLAGGTLDRPEPPSFPVNVKRSQSSKPLGASGAGKKSTTPRTAQPGTEGQVLTRPLGRLSGDCGRSPRAPGLFAWLSEPLGCLASGARPLRKLSPDSSDWGPCGG